MPGSGSLALHLNRYGTGLPHIAREDVDLRHVPGERNGISAAAIQFGRDEMFASSGNLLRVGFTCQRIPPPTDPSLLAFADA
jgi:hypothetical protein